MGLGLRVGSEVSGSGLRIGVEALGFREAGYLRLGMASQGFMALLG